MNLNLHILKSDLKDKCVSARIRRNIWERTLESASVYRQGLILRPEVIYIIDVSIWAEIMESIPGGVSLIIIGDVPDKELVSSDYLIVRNDIFVMDLLDEVNGIFLRYTRWIESLQNAVTENKGLKALGMCCKDIFDNPFQFYNQKTLHCIFTVEDHEKYSLPDSYPRVDENGYMEPELLINLKIENVLSDIAEKPMYILRDNLTLPAVMQDIVIKGSVVGRIIILEVYKTLDERDMALLMVFTDFLKNIMVHSPELYDTRSQFVDATLSNLITGEPVKNEALFSLLSMWHWHVSDRFFCLSAELPSYDRSYSSLNTLAIHISGISGSNCYLIYKDSILFVFNLSVSGKTKDEYLKLLMPVLRDNLLKAGISTEYTDFRRTQSYFKQADLALHVGLKTDPSIWYFRFEKYALSYISDLVAEGTDMEALYPEKLLKLMEHDKDKNTDYVHILKVWLACNMNISETARQLYLHRNTLLYKLEQIKTILGDLLTDNDARLYLMLVLYIRDHRSET